LTLSGDGNSGSYVGSLLVKLNEPSLDVKLHQTQGFHFVYKYTKGDETGLYLDFYWSDPDIESDAKIPVLESDSNGVLIIMRRSLTVLSPHAAEPCSFSVPVPACAEKVWVKVTNNGGTPTGTIVINGDYDSFKERG